MRRLIVVFYLVIALFGYGAVRDRSDATDSVTVNHGVFVMFFVPGSTEISPEARLIVAQAAATVKTQEAATIEIALPPDASERMSLFEARAAAIENVLTAEGADSVHFALRQLSKAEISIPGAGSRAEIRIVQR
jgi:hypothetical protein